MGGTRMNACVVRSFWCVVEETQSNVLLKLSDGELVRYLESALRDRISLSEAEMPAVRIYVNSKLSLIRDLAYARQSPGRLSFA
jgi:hypothetical protein